MNLFPSRAQCVRNIRAFHRRYCVDTARLAEIWQSLNERQTPETIISVQDNVLGLLRRWQAYRNQPASRNEAFLQQLSEDQSTVDALSTIILNTRGTTSLASIIQHTEAIEVTYSFLKSHMLQNSIPARIVTVSKAMLMISGFTIAFDSVILQRIKKSNPNILACSGVWPFCLFLEMLQFVAGEQSTWEQNNGPMSELLPTAPIGHLMDRVLWRPV